MFFSTQDEAILRDGTKQEFVLGSEKATLARNLNSSLKQMTTANGRYLRYNNSDLNMVEESLSRAPMFCNALMTQGYKNILFVGHFNEGQTHWMLDEFSGRMLTVMPEERDQMHSFPDLNITSQFIPLLMKQYGYKCDFKVVSPPEAKYKGVLHQIYMEHGLSDNTLECSQQYKHGQNSWSLQGEHEKFDAVVFLGVPMQDQDAGFEETQVRETFAPLCTPDFDLVDVYYGQQSSVKWYNGEEKDSKTMVDTAFSVRSTWDVDAAKFSYSQTEHDIMLDMIKVF
tara:strand:- start:305 stop:1156 length:852 start_codon:yes stop_codon:yes gene_type:complete